MASVIDVTKQTRQQEAVPPQEAVSLRDALDETLAGLWVQSYVGVVTLSTTERDLAQVDGGVGRFDSSLWSSTSPVRLLWEVDPWTGSLFGVVLARANTAGLAALLSTQGFQWRECVVEEGDNGHEAHEERLTIRRVEPEALDGRATELSPHCHPAIWYRPAASRWVTVGSHQLYVLQGENEAPLAEQDLTVRVTSLVGLLRFAQPQAQGPGARESDASKGLPRVFDLTGCRVALTERGATTRMTLHEGRWWTSPESRAATKDPTPDFGWLPRQIAREWVAAGLWRQGQEGWQASASQSFASSLLVASLWLRTKGRYAQWQVEDDGGVVRERLTARLSALLSELTPTADKAAPKINTQPTKAPATVNVPAQPLTLGDILGALQKAAYAAMPG